MPVTHELFAEDAYLKRCEANVIAVTDRGVFLDKTVFYPEGGGQVGDAGLIDELRVSDTERVDDGILHLTERAAALADRQVVSASIDWPRRYRVMRHHTLLHLCHIAAVEQLGEEPRVTGSQVRPDKARVDYDYHGEIDLAALLRSVGGLVAGDLPVITEPVSEEHLIRQWRIPGYPPIPCGGTHVRSTAELGPVQIKVQRKGRQGIRIYCNVEE